MPGYCGGNTEAQTVTAGMANVSEVWTQKQTQERENSGVIKSKPFIRLVAKTRRTGGKLKH